MAGMTEAERLKKCVIEPLQAENERLTNLVKKKNKKIKALQERLASEIRFWEHKKND